MSKRAFGFGSPFDWLTDNYITFFLTFTAGPRFPEFYSSGSLQVIRFKRHEGAFVSGHM